MARRIFQQIGNADNAFGGFGHLDGDFVSLRYSFRSQDRAQVRD